MKVNVVPACHARSNSATRKYNFSRDKANGCDGLVRYLSLQNTLKMKLTGKIGVAIGAFYA